ncbi:hypothetical protein C3L33_15225, partial [Rhododendron williamsianum]
MSGIYGPPKPSEEMMIKLIHHAINSGVTFLDTSDIYGPHINEILLGKALKGGMREKVNWLPNLGSSPLTERRWRFAAIQPMYGLPARPA